MTHTSSADTDDLIVIGAGAAGLATAIFTARAAARPLRIRCVDGARHLGAKILVSGGSRCNVTNRRVTERDFWGGDPRIVRGVLRAFPAERAAAFFTSLGVALHEEEDGKLFPDTQRSRTVLDALLGEAARVGVTITSGARVTALTRGPRGFVVATSAGPFAARCVVLATGGRSLPKTGSDGAGYALAMRLGHRCVDTTPALAPLLLEGAMHAALSGIAHPAAATLWYGERVGLRLAGAWLWTHFGASGPLALDLSRHWHRAQVEQRPLRVTLNLLPGETFETMERWLLEQERERPRAQATTVLATRLPAAVASMVAARAGIPDDRTLAHLGREARRGLVRQLVELPLPIGGSRGYGHAEVTAGGIPLDEVEPATLESRRCPGLFFAGEVLDVDGRLGGFNFQWAWSSGWLAGQAIAKRLAELGGVHAEV